MNGLRMRLLQRSHNKPRPWKAALLLAAMTALVFATAGHSQQTVTVPPDAKAGPQSEPWMKIPVPPLAPFHPEPPKRVELKNGLVILLEEDHELPFINGSINLRGGERDVPADKTGLIDLYGETWRTSGTTTMNGDKLDDLLEAKAAKVETGGDIDSTAVSWECLTKDEDQVFG
ncbi:MAG TPA: insulinase family protein, partial [Silvibacterium sp.]|nr:insulinase family protein [Silvibacterium sp.]